MVTADAIRDLRNHNETESIKRLLSDRLQNEEFLYLTKKDLKRIADWKSADKRRMKLLEGNNDEAIRDITTQALSDALNNQENEITQRMDKLKELNGVRIGIASAILALSFPEKYCVIDYRVWWQVFGEEKRNFTSNDYINYLNRISTLAVTLNWSMQETELAIWHYDKLQQFT